MLLTTAIDYCAHIGPFHLREKVSRFCIGGDHYHQHYYYHYYYSVMIVKRILGIVTESWSGRESFGGNLILTKKGSRWKYVRCLGYIRGRCWVGSWGDYIPLMR